MVEKYNFNIVGGPDYSMLNVDIPSNNTLLVEAAAMATMDTNIKMKAKAKGGFKRLLGGESFIINEFTAENGAGEINISPNLPGDIAHFRLDSADEIADEIFLQSSCFLASSTTVKTDAKWGGIKGFFSGMGLLLLKCTGDGDLWFNSYGGIIEMEVANSKYVVDTAHVVAFTSGLDYRVKSVGKMKSLFFSGEGLVCEFDGTGKIWVQSRKVMPLVNWADPFRRVINTNSGD